MHKQYMGKKILFADDDLAIVDAMQMILEDAGYSVCTTVDGETILTMHRNLPDVLLLDIWMSGQDGREIAKILKHQDSTKRIPIIMISASKDIDKSARDAGADDFLPKPFEMEDLLEIVQKHCGKSS